MSTLIQDRSIIDYIKKLEQRVNDIERQQRTISTNQGAKVDKNALTVGLPVLGNNAKGIEILKDKIRLYTNNPSGDITAQMDITWDSWTNVINIPFLTALFAQKMDFIAIPANSSSSGEKGQITADNNFVYICTATNTWRRIGINSF